MGKQSAGVHSNVSRKTLNAIRRNQDPAIKQLNILKAWEDGRNPWITIANPNKEQTNKRFIRVKANEHYGHPKERLKKLFVIAGS